MRKLSDLVIELLAAMAAFTVVIVVWSLYLCWMIIQMVVTAAVAILAALCFISLLFTCGGK